jgi:hypothetical protein
VPLSALLDFPWLLLTGGLLTGIRRWRAAPSAAAPAVRFEVRCACGQLASGLRAAGHQVVPCAHCGAEMFILPLNRLPAVQPSRQRRRGAREPHPIRGRWRIWLGPALAVAGTVLGLVIAYQFLIPPREQERAASQAATPAGARADVAAHLAAARAHLTRGNVHLALAELKRANSAGEPTAWPPERRREWAQLKRQAELLGDLSAESLEGILGHALLVQEREWQAEFAQRYRGKAIVLDLEVRIGGGGRPEHDWLLRARDETAHLDLDDLELLRRLPLDPPQRVLFGGRLGSVRREPGRGFVVRLEPASGVLITDRAVAVACFLRPEEPDVQALLERQAEWAKREPVP